MGRVVATVSGVRRTFSRTSAAVTGGTHAGLTVVVRSPDGVVVLGRSTTGAAGGALRVVLDRVLVGTAVATAAAGVVLTLGLEAAGRAVDGTGRALLRRRRRAVVLAATARGVTGSIRLGRQELRVDAATTNESHAELDLGGVLGRCLLDLLAVVGVDEHPAEVALGVAAGAHLLDLAVGVGGVALPLRLDEHLEPDPVGGIERLLLGHARRVDAVLQHLLGGRVVGREELRQVLGSRRRRAKVAGALLGRLLQRQIEVGLADDELLLLEPLLQQEVLDGGVRVLAHLRDEDHRGVVVGGSPSAPVVEDDAGTPDRGDHDDESDDEHQTLSGLEVLHDLRAPTGNRGHGSGVMTGHDFLLPGRNVELRTE